VEGWGLCDAVIAVERKRVATEPECSGKMQPGGRFFRLGELTTRNFRPLGLSLWGKEQPVSRRLQRQRRRRSAKGKLADLLRRRFKTDSSSRWLRRMNQGCFSARPTSSR
jgi:hypothetical protein